MPAETVLLTRPEADSRRDAKRLAELGIATVTWPLTRIVAAPGPVEVPPGTDALVFTSQNAVLAFADACSRRDLPAWCVGARTARAAGQAGFVRVISADGDVAALAARLRAGPPGRLLYLRGREVSADLGALLAGSGNHLETRVVYSAEPGGPPPDEVRALLESGGIAVAAIWSRRAAAMLAEAIRDHPDWPVGAIRVAAISGRAAAPLDDCGLAGVIIARRPDGEAMVEAIRAALRQ